MTAMAPSAPSRTTRFSLRLLTAACLLALGAAAPVFADGVICEWNAAVINVVRADSTAPGIASRNLAIMHVAAADALAAGGAAYRPYCFEGEAPGEASPDALAAHACHRAAVALFPSHHPKFDNLLARQRLAADDLAGWRAAAGTGRASAAAILTRRSDDGASRNVTYIPRDEPGKWRRTPPYFRPPELPHWNKVTPFCLDRPDQFRPPAPPVTGSAEFKTALAEVDRLGREEAPDRTDEQTQIARFWSCFSYTATPAGHWNIIARDLVERRGLELAESARLFALLNLALADAGIAAWDCKFHYEFWRPAQALGDDWSSLLEAPPHPEYVSGHSTFSGAGAKTLATVFGADTIPFTATSDSLPGVRRRFESFSACAAEMGQSRLYGGIHYGFSNTRGLKLGAKVAGVVVRSAFAPIESDNQTK